VKRNWLLLVFVVIHGLILLVLFRSGIYHNSSMQNDVSLFFDYSSKIVGGAWPYRDFTVEYPPLAFIFFTLPRLVASTLSVYQLAFAIEVFIFDALGLFLLSKLSKQLGCNRTMVLAIYSVLLLAIGPIIIFRYDIIPAVTVIACLYAFSKQKYRLSWVILTIAALTKIYPAVIAPILLLYQLSHRQYKEMLRGVVVIIITTVIIITPGLILNPSGFLESFTMQMQRGLHAESTYASFLLLGQNMGLTDVTIRTIGPTPLSVNVVSPLASTLARTALWVMLPALGLIYWLFYRHRRRQIVSNSSNNQTDTADVIHYSFLAILVFLLTSNIFSPQFLIWLYPFVPLVTRRWRYLPWLTMVAVCAITYYLYPMHYNSFMSENPRMVMILFARNFLLLVLLGLSIEWKSPIPVTTGEPSSRLRFKTYAPAVMLCITAVSILGFQICSNRNIISGEFDRGRPGNTLPGSRPGNLPDNGLPDRRQPNGNSKGLGPNDQANN
jgi:uncharacterized membrane protein